MSSTNITLKTGTSTEISDYAGAKGEIVYNSTINTIVVFDGVNLGGHHLAKTADGASVASATLIGVAKFSTENFLVSNGDVTIKDNGVILGTETTGNYMKDVTGSGHISISHTAGEASSADISTDATTSSTANTIVLRDSVGNIPINWGHLRVFQYDTGVGSVFNTFYNTIDDTATSLTLGAYTSGGISPPVSAGFGAELLFNGHGIDNNTFDYASISGIYAGTHAVTGNGTGDIVFKTAGSDGLLTEKARITSSGDFGGIRQVTTRILYVDSMPSASQDNIIEISCWDGFTTISDELTAEFSATSKILFTAGTGSTAHGYIYHETASANPYQTDLGVIHLSPAPNNGESKSHVAINAGDVTRIKLFTTGNATFNGQITAGSITTSGYITTTSTLTANHLHVSQCNIYANYVTSHSTNGNMYFFANGSGTTYLGYSPNNSVKIRADWLLPDTDDTISLGAASLPWKKTYTGKIASGTSQGNLKLYPVGGTTPGEVEVYPTTDGSDWTSWGGVLNLKPGIVSGNTSYHSDVKLANQSGLLTINGSSLASSHGHPYSSLTNVPSSFPPGSHTHTSGDLPTTTIGGWSGFSLELGNDGWTVYTGGDGSQWNGSNRTVTWNWTAAGKPAHIYVVITGGGGGTRNGAFGAATGGDGGTTSAFYEVTGDITYTIGYGGGGVSYGSGYGAAGGATTFGSLSAPGGAAGPAGGNGANGADNIPVRILPSPIYDYDNGAPGAGSGGDGGRVYIFY